jgi:hypothetical protein
VNKECRKAFEKEFDVAHYDKTLDGTRYMNPDINILWKGFQAGWRLGHE